MIKVGDDEHGDFDLSKMGVDTSKLVGTGRISFLEDTETVPAYALEGGQGQDIKGKDVWVWKLVMLVGE